MSRLDPLRPDQLDDVQRVLYDGIVGGRRASQPLFAIRQEDGALAGPFNAMLHAPSVGVPLSRLGEAIRYDTELTVREREIAILVVAALRRCGYEWYAHERVALAIGIETDELAALKEPATASFSDSREDAVRRFALALANDDKLRASEYDELSNILTARSLVELVALVGYYRLLADMLDTFDVGVPEGPDPFGDSARTLTEGDDR